MPTVRSADADIAYEVSGEGDPVLLVMGFVGDSRMWLAQTPALARRYRCITFDNRGVGGSSLAPGPYSMAQMTSDATAVLDACGVERAHVVGISMGGCIAQHVALRAPERVRSLVLAATWAGPNAYLDRIASLGRQIAETLGTEALVRASILWLFTPAFILRHGALLEQVERLILAFHPPIEAFTNQLHALLEHDVRPGLSEILAPTRVMVGRRDILVPPELSEEIAAAIPGAELLVFDSGHAFNIEEADAFNGAVLEFLERA